MVQPMMKVLKMKQWMLLMAGMAVVEVKKKVIFTALSGFGELLE
jgi:hypothetical protein